MVGVLEIGREQGDVGFLCFLVVLGTQYLIAKKDPGLRSFLVAVAGVEPATPLV